MQKPRKSAHPYAGMPSYSHHQVWLSVRTEPLLKDIMRHVLSLSGNKDKCAKLFIKELRKLDIKYTHDGVKFSRERISHVFELVFNNGH